MPSSIQSSGKWGSAFWICLALWATLCCSSAWAIAPTEELNGLTVMNPHPTYVSQAQNPLNSSPAWMAFTEGTGQGWQVEWNIATGLPHRALPAGYDAAVAAGVVPSGLTDRTARAAILDASAVDRMSRTLYQTLRVSYPTLPSPENLQYLAIEKQANVWWVIYGQTAGGVRVEGARADFRYSADGKLLYFGLDLIPGTMPAAVTSLDAAAAEKAAIDDLANGGLSRSAMQTATNVRLASTARVERNAWVAAPPAATTSLVYLPVVSADGATITVRAAWVVRTAVSTPPARFVSWVDAGNGRILRRENEIDYDTISGTATGDTQPAVPDDPYTNLPERYLRMTVAGVGDAFSDPNGIYSITTPDGAPRQVTSALTGHYGAVANQGGPNPLFTGTATPGTPLPVNFDDSNSDPASRDAYYFANLEHDYIRNIDPPFTGMDYEVPLLTNEAQTCNAFWDGYNINFFQAGGGCTNTGQIADVIEHEYGHGVTQFVYAPVSPDGASNEGWSDYIAASMTDQPLIGRGFYGPGTYLRTCLNTRQYPAPECGGEVHCVGECMMGSCWWMRSNLIDRYGHARGVAHSDSLFHFAKYGRALDMPGYYLDVLAVDDNNGSLVDGTPNAPQIINGFFDHHSIGPGWTLNILDTPLKDTEDTSHPYPVVAVFSSPAALLTDSLAVYYSTEPVGGGQVSGPFRLGMAPTGNLREYHASIPAQPLGTEVLYYIKAACDTLGLVAVDPPGAPGTQHTFNVNPDHTPPTIISPPLYNECEATWPVAVQATVTDNIQVGQVQLEWSLNSVAQTNFTLNEVGTSAVYRGAFNAAAKSGDQIQYRVKATDAAHSPNTSYAPTFGYYQFNVVHDLADDVEHGQQSLTHAPAAPGWNDQWHIDTKRSHSPTHAWKFGDTGNGNYKDSSNGVLMTPPVFLGAGASLSFWHWIWAETNDSQTAWDGGVVEISTDAGVTWSEIVPAGGYPYTIVPNPASPFPANYPCFSGHSSAFTQVQFDLSAYASMPVQIRMHFGSDGAVGYEGWYIDDFDLNPGTFAAGVDNGPALPSRSGLLGASPNPFHPSTRIAFAVAAGVGHVRLDILDVTGRRIRTLVNGPITAGTHAVVWDGRTADGRNVGSGIYFTRLEAGKEEFSGKLVLMK